MQLTGILVQISSRSYWNYAAIDCKMAFFDDFTRNDSWAMWSLVCYLFSFLFGCFLFMTHAQKKKTDQCREVNSPKRRRISPTIFKHKSLDGLRAACEDIGLEDCGLTIGVDFTASNEWQGRRTFHQECLHLVSPVHPMNPYQRTILAFGSTLAPVKTSQTIAAFGFGDSKTKDHDVFPLNQQNGGNCTNIEHVLKCYKHCAASVVLSGPTSFVPIIQKAINTTRKNPQFHVLLIIADGCMSDEPATRKAISEAYKHPISIILVGVGDGPWDKMHAFNDKMSRQGFNFHFVEYDSSVRYSKSTSESFLLHAFMMIPDQYESMKRRGLFHKLPPSPTTPIPLGITPESEKKLLQSAGKAKRLKFRLKNSLKIVDSKINHILPHSKVKTKISSPLTSSVCRLQDKAQKSKDNSKEGPRLKLVSTPVARPSSGTTPNDSLELDEISQSSIENSDENNERNCHDFTRADNEESGVNTVNSW